MTEWTPAEQARHRADLLAALDGPGPDDGTWQQLVGQVFGAKPMPRVDRPHSPRSPEAKVRRKHRRKVCAACQDRRHGPDCAIATHTARGFVRCRCTCRAVLGLTEFLDATAPEVADLLEAV